MNLGSDDELMKQLRAIHEEAVLRPTVAKAFRSEEEAEEALSKLEPVVAVTIRKFVSALMANPEALENQAQTNELMCRAVCHAISEIEYGDSSGDISRVSQGRLLDFLLQNQVEIKRVARAILTYLRSGNEGPQHESESATQTNAAGGCMSMIAVVATLVGGLAMTIRFIA